MSECPYCGGRIGSFFTSDGYKLHCKKCKKNWVLEKFARKS